MSRGSETIQQSPCCSALPGDNIDTDRIIPARYLKSVSFEGLEQHLFIDDRAQIAALGGAPHPFADPRYDNAAILVVNANFGCGSSREHAPQAIRRRGIRAVVGESFSEIFFGNSVALGLPCVTAAPDAVDTLMRLVTDDSALPVSVDLSRPSRSRRHTQVRDPPASRGAGRVSRRQLGCDGIAAGSLRRSRSRWRRACPIRPSEPKRPGLRALAAGGRPDNLEERFGGMGLLAATEHQSDLTAGTQAGNFDRDQLTVGNLAEGAASWQHRDSHAHFDRPLDAVEARQRDLDVDRRVGARRREARSRAGEGSLCAMTVCCPTSSIVARRRPASGWLGCASMTSSSPPSAMDCRPRSAG